MDSSHSSSQSRPGEWHYLAEHKELSSLLRIGPTLAATAIARSKHPHIFDVDKVMQTVLNTVYDPDETTLGVVLNNTHLLLCEIGQPWYSNDTILSESLMIRIAEPTSHPVREFHATLDAMHSFALHHKCRYVCIGSLLTGNDDAYGRLLVRRGYYMSNHTFMKEIPHG